MNSREANNSEVQEFIEENSFLFWWVKPEDKRDMSINALVEAVLNFGDEKSVKKLFDLIGIKRVANIFYQQISGARTNYHRRTRHFFQIYFQRHAQ
jgi:hypothetical protein